jgi:predicted acyltransferase
MTSSGPHGRPDREIVAPVTVSAPQRAPDLVERAPATRPGRITSLDWIRGQFLCLSVSSVSVLGPRPVWLEHADWIGVHFEDTIFPLFVTLSGCGLAFAYRNAVGWRATIKRSLVLLACGLAYNVVAAKTVDLGTLHWTGPLQVYAVLVLVIGLLHRVVRGPRAWACVTLGIACGQAIFLYAWQSSCPGDALTVVCNPSNVIDRAWMGSSHMYYLGARGHDPEGLPSMLGALVTACAGTTAGHLALSARGSWKAPPKLLAWAGTLFLAAVLAHQFLPAMKRLWTPPFALGIAALGVVALALGMAVMDLPAPKRWEAVRHRVAWPWVAMGRNSLFVYFGSHLLLLVLNQSGGVPSNTARLASRVDFLGGHPRVSLVVVMLALWGSLAAVLHWRRIYLRP